MELIKSTENALGIAFWARFDDHWKLFDISTAETDASNDFPLIESGRIDFDLKFKLNLKLHSNLSPSSSKIFMQSCRTCSDVPQVALSPDTRILLKVDQTAERDKETIDIHYLDPGGTNFSFVTCMSIPHHRVTPRFIDPPELAISANGSKFAMGMACGRVSVWNMQSKIPLQNFTEALWPKDLAQPQRFLQFVSGNLGKEILVFVEVCLMFTF